MARITKAKAFCNDEVAYLAWETDGKIEGGLGFMVTRVFVDTGERRVLPTWVAFKSQSNPDWEEQDTSVWPIQKFSWRDLTLRKSRNTLATRSGPLRVKYEIQPVGPMKTGLTPVPSTDTSQPGKYKGKPIPLAFYGEAVETNEIVASNDLGEVSVGFNNGILSTQNLRKQLHTPKGKMPSAAKVRKRIETVDDPLRRYLAGDILPLLRELFTRAEAENGTIYAALYELSDPELIELLVQHASRLHLILCTAGKDEDTGEWDTTNAEARQRLREAIGTKQLRTRSMQDRMFNTSAGIGHNKFAVLVVGGQPQAVWTGSTNWTPTGLCAQTNNAIVFRSGQVAQHYLDYWQRLHKDKQPVPDPLSKASNANQGEALREANSHPADTAIDAGGTQVQLWFSPNTAVRGSPATRTVPPDLAVLFDLMSKAKHAIFFLVFNPGRTAEMQEDANTAISAALAFGRNRPGLFVAGAISDPTAMPGYRPRDPKEPKVTLPAIYSPAGAPNVLLVRAAAVEDPVANFDKELLKIGHAIVHDKIVVIDPMSEKDCVVVTGSHNLGFKASYANDENLAIVRGNRALACAYAVHVLDVHEHYRFRAVQEEIRREAELSGKSVEKAVDKGFLKEDDTWQDKYVAPGHVDLRSYLLAED
ncbi:phospholipase D-like domain-containing protein [Acidovorax sp. PRC11]|jgi:phosphatidylserine/phosphatidylglycerophosphate/cardiolipin synthase-like enzyme|uniref:phospholipase D-like domain-containing protein n=1 Tax=Acidovorax sp. PRC11 TaxID=2962592 RepID=UPI002881BA4B|nr:phospholipase D-like domain-containing protein [Acidovorax sp. PRC11]MDT0136449.1 phospholipase D-like domain-containing protein [Acidovorax sp. PRC11]